MATAAAKLDTVDSNLLISSNNNSSTAKMKKAEIITVVVVVATTSSSKARNPTTMLLLTLAMAISNNSLQGPRLLTNLARQLVVPLIASITLSSSTDRFPKLSQQNQKLVRFMLKRSSVEGHLLFRLILLRLSLKAPPPMILVLQVLPARVALQRGLRRLN